MTKVDETQRPLLTRYSRAVPVRSAPSQCWSPASPVASAPENRMLRNAAPGWSRCDGLKKKAGPEAHCLLYIALLQEIGWGWIELKKNDFSPRVPCLRFVLPVSLLLTMNLFATVSESPSSIHHGVLTKQIKSLHCFCLHVYILRGWLHTCHSFRSRSRLPRRKQHVHIYNLHADLSKHEQN